MDVSKIIDENNRRNALLDEPYDPIVGIGSPIDRQSVVFSDMPVPFHFPVSMLNVDWVNSMVSSFSSISDAASFVRLSPAELLFDITQERYKHDFEFWAATTITITNKDTFQDFLFVLRRAQRLLLAVLERMRLAGVPIRVVLLKARQWGGSTLVQIYMMWIQQIHRKNWHLAVCAQDDSAAKNIRGLYTNAASKYPESIGKITLRPYEGSTKNRICTERGGIVGVGSINNPDQFRSYNFAMVHLCLNPNTEIPVNNGFTKLAKDIREGDRVFTHTGAETKVKNVTISKPNKRNGNGKSIIIKPWGQQPVELTPNHPVFTDKGWVNAEDLSKEHLLSFPVRQIRHSINHIQLPVYENKRKQGGGTIPSGSGKIIHLNSEVGYAFGYYLAEGSVHVRRGTINEVTFSRDKDDFKLAERAIKAFSSISNKVRTERSKTSRTEHDIISDSVLARWMFDTFNMKENKVLPDWFFDCGKDFLEGVLVGYLSGDGSKSNEKQGKYDLASVRATSISSSIAMQIRDIAISLGIGIASLDIKEAGNHYGRNCKRAYILRWAGSSARKLRKLLGYYVPNNGYAKAEKSFISNGFVFIKIKSITESTISEVVDIEVEHNDHSFRTISFSVKNSEVGVWQDTPKRTAKDLITSLKETVPDVPYSVIVEESTAKGLNYFYDSWRRALRPNNRIEAVFVPWYQIDRCRIPIEGDVRVFCENLSQYDLFLWEQGATLEGIAWYNKHKADRYEEEESKNQMFSEWQMQQENPTTPEEAFRSAGEKRFNPKYIAAMEQDCCAPEFIGEVTGDAMQGDKAFDNLELVANNKGNLSIWSMPDKSIDVLHRYIMFADIGGVWRGADFSTFVVIDRYWMIDGGDPEVVAVYRGHMDKDLFGWYAAQVAYLYNNALLAFETNSLDKDRNKDDHFQTVIEKVVPFYRNLYIRNNPEKVGDDYVPIYGWHTNKKTKPGMIDNLYAASRERYMKDKDQSDGYALYVRDIRILKEMNWYEKKEDGTLGAVKGEHDDLVMATAGAYTIAVEKMPMPKIIDNTMRPKRKVIRGESSF